MSEQLAYLDVATKNSILQVLDQCRVTINRLTESRDASNRLFQHASARAQAAEDRLERVTLMLSRALGYQDHMGQTPEELAAEIDAILQGLRGDGQ